MTGPPTGCRAAQGRMRFVVTGDATSPYGQIFCFQRKQRPIGHIVVPLEVVIHKPFTRKVFIETTAIQADNFGDTCVFDKVIDRYVVLTKNATGYAHPQLILRNNEGILHAINRLLQVLEMLVGSPPPFDLRPGQLLNVGRVDLHVSLHPCRASAYHEFQGRSSAARSVSLQQPPGFAEFLRHDLRLLGLYVDGNACLNPRTIAIRIGNPPPLTLEEIFVVMTPAEDSVGIDITNGQIDRNLPLLRMFATQTLIGRSRGGGDIAVRTTVRQKTLPE